MILSAGLLMSVAALLMFPTSNDENKILGPKNQTTAESLIFGNQNFDLTAKTMESANLIPLSFIDSSVGLLPELTQGQFIFVYVFLFFVFMVQSTRLNIEVRMYQFFHTSKNGEIQFDSQEAMSVFEINGMLSKFFKVLGIASGFIAILALI